MRYLITAYGLSRLKEADDVGVTVSRSDSDRLVITGGRVDLGVIEEETNDVGVTVEAAISDRPIVFEMRVA